VNKLDKALALLRHPDGEITLATIRAAYTKRCREVHPDTGDGSVPIQDLRAAFNLLSADVATQNNACALCCGTGKVRGKIGMQACSACEGTGERK